MRLKTCVTRLLHGAIETASVVLLFASIVAAIGVFLIAPLVALLVHVF